MLQPFLFVGLGGSGGKTLRFIKRELTHWLEEVDPGGDFPDAWRFLHIDSPTVQDGASYNKYVDMLEGDEYLGLVGRDTDFRSVANGLDSIPGIDDELVGWRLDPDAMDVDISIGAGQFRAIGRTIGMLHSNQIRKSLDTCRRKMTEPRAKSRLQELHSLATMGATPGQERPPVVVVVSSLAGGSGAGLLMSVFDILRGMEMDSAIGIFYTPEVFHGEIPPEASGGVYANSLAAISEVLNGHWYKPSSGDGDRTSTALRTAGIGSRLSASGPAYPFLVGMKNAEGTSFGSTKELFEMVGATLAGWATDAEIQGKLVEFTIGNWANAATTSVGSFESDILVKKGQTREWAKPAFNAMGMSRLTIGQRHFLEYSAKRIARDAASFIKGAHVEGDLARIVRRDGISQPTEIAAEIARRQLPEFLRSAQLAERGRDDNQILEALDPKDMDSIVGRFINQVKALAGGSGDTSPGEWRERIFDAIASEIDGFLDEYRSGVDEAAAKWCSEVPQKFCELISSEIAVVGIQVAAAEIRQTFEYFADPKGVIEELRAERVDAEEAGSDSEIRHAIATASGELGDKGRIAVGNPIIDQTIKKACSRAVARADAIVREKAVAMLDSFAQSFLKPLERAMFDAAGEVDQVFQVEAVNWPEWNDGDPPSFMNPPASEVTLIEPDEYAQLFTELMIADTKSGDASDIARREEVRRAVITGEFLDGPDAPSNAKEVVRAIRIERPWWPGTTVVSSDHRTSSTAYFGVNLLPDALEARADAWMNRPSREFTRLRHESLRTYLQEDTMFGSQTATRQTYESRQRKFLPMLQQALRSSAPLISIDSSLAQLVGGSPSIDRLITQVPFSNISGLESQVRAIFEQENVKHIEMTTNAKVQEILISSTLASPIYPFVAHSLMDPIAQNWAQMSNEAGVKAFWNRRRARRIDEFIPAPNATIQAMTRGWFTGMALGIIDVVNENVFGRNIDVVKIGRELRRPAEFPKPMLTRSPEFTDFLPIVLESLAVAFVNVSSSGNLSPLEAYCELRDLGMSDSDHVLAYGEGDRLNEYLRMWIMGERLPEGVVLRAESTGEWSSEGEPESRKKDLLEKLSSVRSMYQQELTEFSDSWKDDRAKLGGHPYWAGMNLHIVRALTELHDTVDGFKVSSGRRF